MIARNPYDKEGGDITIKLRKWRETQGIVYDVMCLLEKTARLYTGEPDQVAELRRLIALVSSHALRPVHDTLRDEHMTRIMEQLYHEDKKQRASVEQ